MLPFFPYYGGKRKVAPKIIPLIKENLNTNSVYYEPFVGAGAIYLGLKHDKNYIADIIPDLINMYESIRDNPEKVLFHLSRLPNDKEHYYQIRNFDRNPNFKRTSNEFQAARFIYTCQTAFGSTRFNNKGQMNQSYGKHPERQCGVTLDQMLELSELLQKTEIKLQPFEETLKYPTNGDFVYLDPPYIESRYDKYYDKIFKFEDMERLKECCDQITSNGAKFILSHSEHKKVNDLFKDYNVRNIEVIRDIKWYENKEKMLEKELVITNF